MDVRLSRLGPLGILIRFADELDAASLARCRGLVRWFEENPPEGMTDFVPACDSLLVEFARAEEAGRAALEMALALSDVAPLPAEEAAVHRMPVCYDGPDLEEFAGKKRLPVEDVVALHSGPIYSVYVIGFSPGFPYLGPLDGRLHMPRRAAPRVRVPAGSVAIGGEHTGVYSIASPGGWWLLGRTAVELFFPARVEGAGGAGAFLLRPGDRVKFEPVRL